MESTLGEQSAGRASGRKPRFTIGLLCDVLWNQYSCDMWAGVRDAAQQQDVNLIYFAGGILGLSYNYRDQANVIYARINRNQLDGLVIWAGQLAHVLGPAKVEEFCRRFRPLPMISIELELPGIPSVLIDNYHGMYDLVTHLIEVHHYQRLAYIDYPTILPITQARYQGYADALRDHGLALNPNLVTNGSEAALLADRKDLAVGGEGLWVLFEKRRLRPRHDIEAIVTVADMTALGALRGLHARGLRVPDDVALVGFDDLEDVRHTRPPLTTVRQSFYEQGRRAADVLLAQLRGETVPDKIFLSMPLIIRRSCGCIDPLLTQALMTMPSTVQASSREKPCDAAACAGILRAMLATIPPEEAQIPEDWTRRFLENFLADLQAPSAGKFALTFEKMLYQTLEAGGDMTGWHRILSAWRTCLLPELPQKDRLMAENLWQQARILLSDMIQREQAYQRLGAARQSSTLRDMSDAIMSTFDKTELMDMLVGELPKVDIPRGYIAVYDNPAAPEAGATLILAYDAGGRTALTPEEQQILPRQLLPDSLLCRDARQSLVVEPLYFRQVQIGFAIFEGQQREGRVYESLRREISSALHGALLLAETTRQQYILDTFMLNVPDSIYFKDRDGRYLRLNPSASAKRGTHSPDELVGKTDFDFFSEDQAQVKYEQEQCILRTGEPLLALEEPDLQGKWELTTKMPLRDEHGLIIGIFGISRDITELKRIQAELQLAYEYVEEQVTTRTIELQQEIVERQRAEAEIRRLQQFLQNIIDSMPSVLLGVDPQGRVTHWNRKAEEVTGVSAAEAQGRRLSDVYPWLRDRMDIVAQAIRASSTRRVPKLVRRDDGRTRYIDLTVYPLLSNGTTNVADANGADANGGGANGVGVDGAVVVLEDVTEQVRIEEHMIHSEKMMTVGGLAAGMAHEINNPLGVILQGIQNTERRLRADVPQNQAAASDVGVSLELVRAYLEQRHILRYLHNMQEAGTRVAQIVGNMLGFSSPASSARVLTDLNRLLDLAIELASSDYELTTTYHFRQITILREYEPDLPKVSCIPSEIQQVALNLLRNAAHALSHNAPAIPPTIRLATRRQGHTVRIDIADNGPGMDADMRRRVFEPFYTTRVVDRGTGLGLSVSYFIVVTHHRGAITVDSVPGHGATFTITLPLSGTEIIPYDARL